MALSLLLLLQAPTVWRQTISQPHLGSRPALKGSRLSTHLSANETPFFAIVWSSECPFVYETLYGGAEEAASGRGAVRTSTLVQALTLGKRLVSSQPNLTYNIYKLMDGTMQLMGSYPKRVNAEGAVIRFRRRRPRSGGADDNLLGIGGMGDDVWRELMEGTRSSVDDAWTAFRKTLELGDEIEIIDEQGNPLEESEEGEYD
ncbi:MAG: hypothetical protein SGPRY_005524 [Prymnesium sp.]